jgi:hypothetical protein
MNSGAQTVLNSEPEQPEPSGGVDAAPLPVFRRLPRLTKRRCFPRIPVNRSLLVAFDRTRVAEMMAEDISPGTVTVVCGREAMRQLAPPGSLGTDTSRPRVTLCIQLPIGDDSSEVLARAYVESVDSGPDDNFRVLLAFDEMTESGTVLLERFVYSCLEPESF